MKINSYDRFNLSNGTRKKLIKQSLNYTIKDGKIYDNETGEYIGDKFQSQTLVPIKSSSNSNYKKIINNKSIIDEHINENGGFVFALFKSNTLMLERFPSLNKKDISRLLFISTYIHYDTGRLQKSDGTIIHAEMFLDMIKMSKKRGKEFINKLINENIITVEDKEIYMHPLVFFRGGIKNIKKIEPDINYVRLFKKTVRDLFASAKENELSHLATIYATLPYINLYYNIICHNPYEKVSENIIPMHTDELAEKLGYSSYNKLTAQLNKLKINDQPVFNYFTDIKDKRKKNIVVNPSVVYSGNDPKQLEAVKAMFVAGGKKNKK